MSLPPFDMFFVADIKMCESGTEMEKNGNKTFWEKCALNESRKIQRRFGWKDRWRT